MNIEAGKYYSFDIKAAEDSVPGFYGIEHFDINVFKDGKARLCVFSNYNNGNYALYFEGQKYSNSYEKFGNKVKYWKGYFYDFLRIAHLLLIVGLVILPFLQVKLSYLESIGSKVVFSITTSLITTIVLNFIGELLKIKNPKTNFKDSLFIFIAKFA